MTRRITALFNVWAALHPWVLLTIALLVPTIAFAYFYYNRTPPTIITGIPAIPEARAGEEIIFNVPMDRDIDRGCSLSLSRSIIDSSLQETRLITGQRIGPDGLRARDAIDDKFFHVRFVVPNGLPSGPAKLMTDITWVCAKNPTTWFVPIQRTWVWPFKVLPPDPKTIIVIPSRP